MSDDTETELARRFPDGPPSIRIRSETGEWTIVSISIQGSVRGAILTHTPARLSRFAREGLETLAARVALALVRRPLVA